MTEMYMCPKHSLMIDFVLIWTLEGVWLHL